MSKISDDEEYFSPEELSEDVSEDDDMGDDIEEDVEENIEKDIAEEDDEDLEKEDLDEEIIEEENLNDEDQTEIDNDDISDFMDTGGDDSIAFEENKRKKSCRRKITKKKLFPFIQKKKKITSEKEREKPLYFENDDLRNTTVNFLSNHCSSEGKTLNTKEPPIFEKAIFEASQQSGKLDKTLYTENVRFFIGAFEILKKVQIIEDIKNKNIRWNTSLFAKEIQSENYEISKLLNPLEAFDNPDYPCPRCKSTKSYRSIKQLRSGDEGASAIFICGVRSCGFKWKING